MTKTPTTADLPTCLGRIRVQNLLPQLPTREEAAVFTGKHKSLRQLLIQAAQEAQGLSAPLRAALQAAVPREAMTAALHTGAVLPLQLPRAAVLLVPALQGAVA